MTNFLALDVGTKRIGVAVASTSLRIAVPATTVEVDGNEIDVIKKLIRRDSIDTVVIGYPRNQAGEATAQTEHAVAFAEKLKDTVRIEFQDESLTSVMAEERLKASGKAYEKGDIDAQAAAIILQDYLELHHAA